MNRGNVSAGDLELYTVSDADSCSSRKLPGIFSLQEKNLTYSNAGILSDPPNRVMKRQRRELNHQIT